MMGAKINTKYKLTFNIDKAMTRYSEEWRANVDYLTLATPFIMLLDPYFQSWSGGRTSNWSRGGKWRRSYATTLSFRELEFDFYLAPSDSLRSMESALSYFEHNPNWEVKKSTDYAGRRVFYVEHTTLKHKTNYGDIPFQVRLSFCFKRSMYCKTVGTGEFVEKTKTVCYD